MVYRRFRIAAWLGHSRWFIGVVLGAQALALLLAFSPSSSRSATAADHAAGQLRSPMVEVSGRVVAVGVGVVGVREAGGEQPVAFMVNGQTRVKRAGDAAPVSALRAGDAVRMTVDGRTGVVQALRAAPRANGPLPSHHDLSWIAALTIVGAASIVFARARRGAWLTAGQIESMRSLGRLRWPGESAMPIGR